MKMYREQGSDYSTMETKTFVSSMDCFFDIFNVRNLHGGKQVIRVKNSWGCRPRTRITWASFLVLKEPSLKLLHPAKLQGTNSSSISNRRCSKSTILLLRNINYNINLLLWLRVGTHIIYIYLYIRRALNTGS